MTDLIPHAPDCPGGETRTRKGNRGDTLERCDGCHRFRIVKHAPERETPPREPAPVEPEPEPRPERHTTHVCRPHHHPVTWRGRGCPHCTRRTRTVRRTKQRPTEETA